MKFIEALQNGEQLLAGAKQNKDVAKLLILHFTKMTPADLYASLNLDIDFDYDRYMAAINEYISGIPLQHIRGYEHFFGRKFTVSPDSFIPRPETELLCEVALERIAGLGLQAPAVADLGTGSGVIAATLKLEMPIAHVYATELSAKALEVARSNAQALHAEVTFMLGSFGQPLLDKGIYLDALVSNPPYINDLSSLDKRVADHDPHLALYGGEDGLNAYRMIFDEMPLLFKKSKRWMACFEIGYDQKDTLHRLAKAKFPNAKVEFVRDYANLWRIMVIEE